MTLWCVVNFPCLFTAINAGTSIFVLRVGLLLWYENIVFTICVFSGCMAALEAEHYLQEHGIQREKSDWLVSSTGGTSLLHVNKSPSRLWSYWSRNNYVIALWNIVRISLGYKYAGLSQLHNLHNATQYWSNMMNASLFFIFWSFHLYMGVLIFDCMF